MQILPSSFQKVFSTFTRKNQVTPDNHSDITLFNDLSESEKQASILKLRELASQQPSGSFDKSTQTGRKLNWKLAIMLFAGISFIVCAIIASVALAMDVTSNPDLVAKLKMSATMADRMALLPKDSDWFYDFNLNPKYTFSPGGVSNANAATFPATAGLGLTLAMLNLGPCSMLPPHIHPRATNFVVAIAGTTRTFMIAENGQRTVEETLTPGQMTIFPTGSVHTMMNVGCENAQLVSALSSDDAGTTNLANAFFSLPANFTSTIIGGGLNTQDIENRIPGVGTGSIAGPEACLAACAAKGKKIKRTW